MRRATVIACAALVLVSCTRRESDTQPSPTPVAGIPASAERLREAVADALDAAAARAGHEADTQHAAIVSSGAGPGLTAVAALEGAADATRETLGAGADVMLARLAPTTVEGLGAGPYVVRIAGGTARFVETGGGTAAEVDASIGDGDGTSPCRVSVDRSERRIALGIRCPSFTAGIPLGEDVGAETAADDDLADANDRFRGAVRTALCDEAEAWELDACTSDFVAGSRDDSLVVSAPVGGDAPVRFDDLRAGADGLFTYLDLPGLDRGFAAIRIAQRPDGRWVAQVRDRDGDVLDEPALTMRRREAGPGGTTERYVSYLDSSIVCVDHDYTVTDVNSGETWVETDIACFGRIAAATPEPRDDVAEPSETASSRPATAAPSPTPARTASPPPTAAPTASPPPTASAAI